MSARVLNPAMMSEMGHRGMNVGNSAGRVPPSRAALERVRRDLFGPVDHAAARALAERELRAQSILDAERWGFDFNLEKPRKNSRYDWKIITTDEIVPEPYALRGMPYLRKHAPSTPKKLETTAASGLSTERGTIKSWMRKRIVTTIADNLTPKACANASRKAERTPPQEIRVPRIDDVANDATTTRTTTTTTTTTTTEREFVDEDETANDRCGTTMIDGGMVNAIPTTPVLPVAARKQQSSITDFMKSRKRSLNSSTKSIVELPEKIARNAGQIRS